MKVATIQETIQMTLELSIMNSNSIHIMIQYFSVIQSVHIISCLNWWAQWCLIDPFNMGSTSIKWLTSLMHISCLEFMQRKSDQSCQFLAICIQYNLKVIWQSLCIRYFNLASLYKNWQRHTEYMYIWIAHKRCMIWSSSYMKFHIHALLFCLGVFESPHFSKKKSTGEDDSTGETDLWSTVGSLSQSMSWWASNKGDRDWSIMLAKNTLIPGKHDNPWQEKGHWLKNHQFAFSWVVRKRFCSWLCPEYEEGEKP